MRCWWRKSTGDSSTQEGVIKSSLHALVEAGAETVVFVSGSATGPPCEEAQRLEGGRIPINLAEATPLAECTQTDSCVCRYDEWPPAGSQEAKLKTWENDGGRR